LPVATAPSVPARRWHRLVLVEDNALVAEALMLALDAEADEIICCRRAEEALHDERCWTADAWVTDLRLPGLNGLRLLEQITALRGAPPCAVILTGDTAPERIALVRASPWPVLFKPVDLTVLIDALQTQSQPTTP
jgi:DNA-binding NarL/FixJ family response regulator